MSAIPELAGVVLVFAPLELDRRSTELETLKSISRPGVPILAVAGGDRRQDSVRMGLAALPRECQRVLVHDSARPFFSPALVASLLDQLTDEIGGVIPAIPVTDTIKQVENHRVLATLTRETLRAVQTPQLFPTGLLRRVHEQALQEDWTVTDDASMIERAGYDVRIVPGETANLKITTPEDLRVLATPAPLPIPCTGFGYDVHAYGGNRPMVLGGMPIAGAPFVKAHSDGDVLLHALCDAILGCLGLGDIGEHFPDSDDRFENISSGILLSEIMDKARSQSLTITHVDLTVIAQTPRLAPHKAAIRGNVARLLELSDQQVNVKATTEEHMGFTGRKEGIKAVAVVTATRTQA
jgi:2-C-methyl-D-erythritol 4-phosphate cytidylyltransferase/2-C-methyl-D-erythritol 2,4-cyclodiphosphate synthase